MAGILCHTNYCLPQATPKQAANTVLALAHLRWPPPPPLLVKLQQQWEQQQAEQVGLADIQQTSRAGSEHELVRAAGALKSKREASTSSFLSYTSAFFARVRESGQPACLVSKDIPKDAQIRKADQDWQVPYRLTGNSHQSKRMTASFKHKS
eukprot:1160147-Pelagomonas_calceolata.AAC.2